MTVALTRSLAAAVAVAATLSGCGGTAPTVPEQRAGAGSLHTVVQPPTGAARVLAVDYAAAGLAAASPEKGEARDDGGALVIVGVFRDGAIEESLDLETLSISVPLSALPDQSGALDVVVDGVDLDVLLEGTADGESRVLIPEQVRGTIHLKYDAPPRPGITLRGDFSLSITTAAHGVIRLDGELDVPVLGN